MPLGAHGPPFSTTLKGWAAGSKCKGRVGGWVAFGVREDFFAVWRALPIFIFSPLQAECACQIQTQTRSFSRQVKTGIILAT